MQFSLTPEIINYRGFHMVQNVCNLAVECIINEFDHSFIQDLQICFTS